MKSNKLTIGILAHVDAGKTTLSESILYKTGSIRKIGRVDHKDAFLDTYELEKARGITIFSKQAVFNLGDVQVTLLDTPGHVDFSSEMERTLQVLDYAVLLINGADGIQGHTQTLWRLLGRYNIPTFIFVNKMDQIGTDRHELLRELQDRFHEECIDFSEGQDWNYIKENVAISDEKLLEKFLETEEIQKLDISRQVRKRKVFPVFFGSAIKGEGVDWLLDGLKDYTIQTDYGQDFGAKVFNISRDEQGNRLTHLKITGGSLQVKETLSNEKVVKDNKDINSSEKSETIWKEKVDQIRIYSGKQFQLVQEVVAGSICAVTGLTNTASGDGLGFEEKNQKPVLEPVLTYRVVTEEACNIGDMLKNLRQLEEEEPHLNIIWNEKLVEIHVQVMGEIEIEILQSIIMERYGERVSFDSGNLVYKETIKEAVIGLGHFEPLRHYAEVHLLMEPGKTGSGMVYELNCSEDILSRNWQRLILTHLKEKSHIGVLTGSEITDMKISIIAGRGHNKHTEGGDFREATFRAVRQGLMQAESLLLEPVYEYRLEIPKQYLGRGMSDIDKMYGRYDDPLIEGEEAVLKGVGPVSSMLHYQTEVNAYTKGEGRLSLNLKGYEPCHNPEEVISEMGYEAEKDSFNPTSSVFCTKGSGYTVPWDLVTKHIHVDSGIKLKENIKKTQHIKRVSGNSGSLVRGVTENEVEEIFLATFGPAKEKNHSLEGRIVYGKNRDETYDASKFENYKKRQQKPEKEKYLLVDGYNIIFAWENLKTLADENLDLARLKLQDILSNYKSQINSTVIVVFDAYKVKGNPGSTEEYHNIHVVYTKEAETADQYIERLVHIIRPEYDVTVATSDNVEQVIIMGKGGRKLTAEGLKLEIDSVDRTIRENYLNHNQKVSQRMEIEKQDKNK